MVRKLLPLTVASRDPASPVVLAALGSVLAKPSVRRGARNPLVGDGVGLGRGHSSDGGVRGAN